MLSLIHICSDGNETLAGEECQPVRQLGILELVVAGRTHNSGQNADEGVAGDLLEGDVGSGALFQSTHQMCIRDRNYGRLTTRDCL